MPLQISLSNAGTNINCQVAGLLSGTAYQVLRSANGTMGNASTVISTTAAGTAVSLVDPLDYALYYYQATQNGTSSDIEAIWHGASEYQRADALTLAFRQVIVDSLPAINAAWRQFAAAAGYTAGTVTASDIVIGDRLDPAEGRVTLCIVNGLEDTDFADAQLRGFKEYAHRTLRGYVDLVEDNETDSRETERERLCDTLRGALYDILMSAEYDEITDSNGWAWWNCYPVTSETGSVPKRKKFYWAFEVTWQATTEGSR